MKRIQVALHHVYAVRNQVVLVDQLAVHCAGEVTVERKKIADGTHVLSPFRPSLQVDHVDSVDSQIVRSGCLMKLLQTIGDFESSAQLS